MFLAKIVTERHRCIVGFHPSLPKRTALGIFVQCQYDSYPAVDSNSTSGLDGHHMEFS